MITPPSLLLFGIGVKKPVFTPHNKIFLFTTLASGGLEWDKKLKLPTDWAILLSRPQLHYIQLITGQHGFPI
jgi:hypothetical protein